MTELGWVGVWLLIGSIAAIVLEAAVAGLWSLRLARRSRDLALVLEREQSAIQADLTRLRAAIEETKVLWAPHARVLKFLRHPLVVALIGYYGRRWAA